MKENGENRLVFFAVGFRRAAWLSDSSEKRICFALLILLIGEVLGVAFYFDIRNIVAPAYQPLPGLLAPPLLLRFFLVFCLAATIFEIGRLKTEIHTPLQISQIRFSASWSVLHLLAFAAFVTLSTQLDTLGNKTVSPEKVAVYLAIWLGLATAFVLFWLRSLAPLTWWWQWLKNARRSVLAAASVSLLIVAVSTFSQDMWYGFNGLTFRVVQALLLLYYPTVIADNEAFLLGTPAFQVEIAQECSGYEGMGLVTVFLGLYLWLRRQELRFPRALLLLPLGLTVIWFFNALRIAALIAIGSSGSPDIAMNGFHSQAGWIAFILVALLLMWIAPRLPGLTKAVTPAATQSSPHAALASALLMPFMVLMAAQMLTTSVSAGNDLLYPVKIIAAATALWIYRPVYQAFLGKVAWPAVLIGFAVFVIWWLLEPGVDAATNRPPRWLVDLPAGYAIVWLAFRVIGSVLVVPLAEELLFRGYLLRKLVSRQFEAVDPRRFTWLSWLVSSLLFGWLHQRWLAGSLAGMAFAYAQYRQGRLADAVLAHATANALIAIAVLGFGQWGLWS